MEALAEQVNNAAEERLSQVMPHFFDVFHRTSDAAGTAMDAGGRPFRFELFLEGLERIEIQFDRQGKATLLTLVMHPSMAEKLRSMPPTLEQQKAMDALIERKRIIGLLKRGGRVRRTTNVGHSFITLSESVPHGTSSPSGPF